MVNATDELLAEVAEAEAAGLKPEELQDLRGQVEGAAAVPAGMSYQVPDTDKAAWIAAYRLSVDHAGVERGTPMKLAKGQLGMYLGKRRPLDGGKLFTVRMPAHLPAEPIFQCFAAPSFCQSKFDTKANLITHMYAAHPAESAQMPEEIEMVRKAANKDNAALQDIVRRMAETPDPGAVVVPQEIRDTHDATVPDVHVQEQTLVSISYDCDCGWKNVKNTRMGLTLHQTKWCKARGAA